MVQYEKAFSCLIHQKNKDRTAKIERIMTEIKEIGLFKVEGPDDFKEKFDACCQDAIICLQMGNALKITLPFRSIYLPIMSG